MAKLLHFPSRGWERSWPPSLLPYGREMELAMTTQLHFPRGEWERSWPLAHLPRGTRVTRTAFSFLPRDKRQRPWLPPLLPSGREMGVVMTMLLQCPEEENGSGHYNLPISSGSGMRMSMATVPFAQEMKSRDNGFLPSFLPEGG